MDALIDVQAVAAEAFATLDTGGQIQPFSSRTSSFNLDDAYRVTAAVKKIRQTRGELAVGRKIGFTNRTIWAEYNVYEPVWGYVYDRTVHNLSEIGDTFPLVGLAEPRIEPEIVFKLAVAPAPGMGERALLESIDWVDMVSKSYSRSLLDGSFPRPTRSRRSVCTARCSLGLVIQSQRTAQTGAGRFRPSKSI